MVAAAAACPALTELLAASVGSLLDSLGPGPGPDLTGLAFAGRSLALLDLSYTALESLGAVLDACPALVRLQLLSCKRLPDAEIGALAPRAGAAAPPLPRLISLDVGFTAVSDDTAAALISGRWPGGSAAAGGHGRRLCLTSLSLSGCVGVTGRLWELLLLAGDGGGNEGIIKGVDATMSEGGGGEEGKPEAAAWPSLQFLTAFGCPAMASALLPRCPAALARLASLRLRGEVLSAVALPLPALTSLALGGPVLASLRLDTPRLVRLDLRGCPAATRGGGTLPGLMLPGRAWGVTEGGGLDLPGRAAEEGGLAAAAAALQGRGVTVLYDAPAY